MGKSWAAVLGGMLSGAINGGFNAGINGGNFLRGAAKGAAYGAASVAIVIGAQKAIDAMQPQEVLDLGDGTAVTGDKGAVNPEDLPIANPEFYDESGEPLSVHMSLDEALQAGEDTSRAAAEASGTDYEYGVMTIEGHVTSDGVQTYYNSAPGTSHDSHAIRWSVKGLQDKLVAINHSHPNSLGFSPGDRKTYKSLVESGFNKFKGVYMFDGKGNHWYGPSRKTWWFFRTRTHSCGAASATVWSCPSL